jgi:hypothetical protein
MTPWIVVRRVMFAAAYRQSVVWHGLERTLDEDQDAQGGNDAGGSKPCQAAGM